jgi:hypothetical protein
MLRTTITAATLLSLPAAVPAQQPQTDPLRFFVGRTEDQGVMKVIFKAPYRTDSISNGKIEPDGSLLLVQRVQDQGEAPHQRVWRIRQTGAGHYSGAMSDAVGPVTIDRIGDRYRFEFRMKGSLSIEQWLTPLPGGMAARSSVTVRKLGFTVATDQGLVRRLPID